jgi:hypothetical protein
VPAAALGDPRGALSSMRSAAERFTSLLPAGLRASPRWAAAGALAGALGCAAAGAFITPVAIAALPTWAAIGAAVGALLPRRGRHEDTEPSAAAPEPGDAVRAATLWALVLELQGRPEPVISRILDRTLSAPEVDRADLAKASHVRPWLDVVRHRLDLALARSEGGA